MGQKINPLDLRLGVTQGHHSLWFAHLKKKFQNFQNITPYHGKILLRIMTPYHGKILLRIMTPCHGKILLRINEIGPCKCQTYDLHILSTTL